MERSDKINQLAAALVKAQADMGYAKKDSNNPFFKSKYADLTEIISVIKEPLIKHGISFLQLLNQDNGMMVVDTMLLHESGEYIISRTPVIIAKERDPQSAGSAITYARRYGLQAMLGIPATDDDAESAMIRPTVAKNAQVQKVDKTSAPRGNDLDDLFN